MGREQKSLTCGYMPMDGTPLSLLKVGKNIIILQGGWISPYIVSFYWPYVNYIEEDIGVYSIFLEEYNDPIPLPIDPYDNIWHMHFDKACSY